MQPSGESTALPSTNSNSFTGNNIPSTTIPQVIPSISVASLVAKHQSPIKTISLTVTTTKPSVTTESRSPRSVNTIIPTASAQVNKKTVEPPISPPEKSKPNTISPVSTYTDPLEQSLANLEHDIKHTDPIDAIAQSTLMQIPSNFSNPVVSHTNSITILQPNSIGVDLKMPVVSSNVGQANSLIHTQTMETQSNPSNMLHGQNNGLGIKHELEIGSNNNGLPQTGLSVGISISSMFDQLPPTVGNKIKNDTQIKLEDPVVLLSEKKLSDPKIMSQSFGSFKSNKQENNVKNASSWSSLAKGKSPQNSSSSGSSKQQVMDSFKAFQNKAKEKADREKQRLENLELKRQQREQAERERLRAENERRREREEEDALEKAR